MELDAPLNQHSARAPQRVLLGIACSFLLLAALIAAIQLLWARSHALDGIAQLNRAIATVKSPSALLDPVARAKAVQALRTAKGDFAAARSDLDVWSEGLVLFRWVPHYGPQIAVAPGDTKAAYYATSSALDIVTGAESLLSELRPRHRKDLLRRLGGSLLSGKRSFIRAAFDATTGVTALASIPAVTGGGALEADQARLRRDLPRLEGAAIWLSVMPQILGEGSFQRDLFCWENADEIRATGGFIGAVDLLTLRKGILHEHFSGSAIERGRPPRVRLPFPEALTTSETTWIFRDSNVSPSFPLSARIERWFYRRDTGTPVNGVIDFVDQGITEVLQATGPIYLPAYHVVVTAKNAERLATRFASANPVNYRGPNKPPRSGNLDTYRKQFLGFEFAAILRRLQNLPPTRWAALGQAMERAIQRKDILMWSSNPTVEAAITLAGGAGRLTAPRGDFLYVVDDNRSYNKIGPWVHESASYHTDLVQSYWLDSTLTLKYHLAQPPSWMEGYGPDLGASGNKYDFRDFVRVFIPPGAVIESVRGLNQTAPFGFIGRSLTGAGGYGLTQVAGWFTLKPRRDRIVRITYAIPANALPSGLNRYHLTVVRQPGTRLLGVAVQVQSLGPLRLALPGKKKTHLVSVWLPLDRDRSLWLDLAGPGQANLIPISRPFQADPLIPTRSLHGLY